MELDKSRTGLPESLSANSDQEMVRDLNQQVTRSRLMNGISPCISTTYRAWKHFEHKRVTAWEACALQGIYLDSEAFPAALEFGPPDFMTLAGEASCMPQALVHVLALLVCVCLGHLLCVRSSSAQTHRPLLPPIPPIPWTEIRPVAPAEHRASQTRAI